jgi:hypothetical protein
MFSPQTLYVHPEYDILLYLFKEENHRSILLLCYIIRVNASLLAKYYVLKYDVKRYSNRSIQVEINTS